MALVSRAKLGSRTTTKKENFGTSDNAFGQIIENINDFDESVIADFQFDVWRMATSVILSSAEM